MKLQKSEFAVLIIIFASFIIASYLYPIMPNMMASHWNYKGEVDDYLPKSFLLFLMPIISVFLFLIFLIIPRIDPLKENIKKFRKQYDRFIILINLFIFYIYILTILWSLGSRFNMILFMLPVLAVIFYYSGVLMEKSERNWFIGIRTPWTLSSEEVWRKTNKLGGKLFKAMGIIILFGIFIPDFAIFVIVIPIILLCIYPVVYSYIEFKKEQSKK